MHGIWGKLVITASVVRAASDIIVSNSSLNSDQAASTTSVDLTWARSPQCTSSIESVYSSGGNWNSEACCGACTLAWGLNAHIYYFPSSTANYQCLSTAVIPDNYMYTEILTTATTNDASASTPLTTAPASLANQNATQTPMVAVLNNSIYTSPYVYLSMLHIEAYDACGMRAAYTSQTLSFQPGELSTMQGYQYVVKPFDFGDLPCPPPSVYSANPWLHTTALYRPEFVAPLQRLWQIDPLFNGCGMNNQVIMPPHSLISQPGLILTSSSPAAAITPPTPSPGLDNPSPMITPSSGTGLVHTPESFLVIPKPNPTSTASSTPIQNDQSGNPTDLPDTIPTSGLPTITAIRPTSVAQTVVIGTETVSTGSSGLMIGPQTLQPGSVITVGTNTVSLAPASSEIVIDGSTITMAPQPTASSYIVAGQTITAKAGGFIVDGQTLSPGGTAVIISGTTMSLASNSLVVGSSTFALPTATSADGDLGSSGTSATSSNGSVVLGSANNVSIGLRQNLMTISAFMLMCYIL